MNNEYNIHFPGRVVTYYPEDQTADIQICAESIVDTFEEMDKLHVRKVLKKVPVQTAGGGNWHLTFPIKPGDPCLLLFSQVGYDHWFYEDKDEAGVIAKNPAPWLRRCFDITDGFAQVGFNTLPRAVQSYSPTDSEWRNQDAAQVITLGEDLTITIKTTASILVQAPEVTIDAATSILAKSPSITLDGAVHITGATTSDSTGTFSGDVIAAGISTSTHTHTGNLGTPTSPPQ